MPRPGVAHGDHRQRRLPLLTLVYAVEPAPVWTCSYCQYRSSPRFSDCNLLTITGLSSGLLPPWANHFALVESKTSKRRCMRLRSAPLTSGGGSTVIGTVLVEPGCRVVGK